MRLTPIFLAVMLTACLIVPAYADTPLVTEKFFDNYHFPMYGGAYDYSMRESFNVTTDDTFSYFTSTNMTTGKPDHLSFTVNMPNAVILNGYMLTSTGRYIPFKIEYENNWAVQKVLKVMVSTDGQTTTYETSTLNFLYTPTTQTDLGIPKTSELPACIGTAIGWYKSYGYLDSVYLGTGTEITALTVNTTQDEYITGISITPTTPTVYKVYGHVYSSDELIGGIDNAQTVDAQTVDLISLIKGSYDTMATLLGTTIMLFGMFKYVFIDNWLLCLICFELGAMVLSVDKSGNPFKIISAWVNYHIKFFMFMKAAIEFVLAVFSYVASTIYNVVKAFWPI